MMGGEICDPEGVEMGGSMEGMNLLPIVTTLQPEKVRRQVHGTVNELEGIFSVLSGLKFNGYEIHMGASVKENSEKGETEGVFITGTNKNVYGTYVHGIFDKSVMASALVGALARNKGIAIENESCVDYMDFKQKQYDKLADILSEYLNMEEIYGMLGEANIR